MTDDVAAAYEEDAALTPEESTNILAQITVTAAELREAKAHVLEAEAALKSAQERVRGLEEVTLPQLMDEARQLKLTTEDGWEIERANVVRASISAENMPAAVMWLRTHNHPIFKREVKLAFDKGEEQQAAHAVDLLKAENFAPTDKYTVHPQTLGALVRELMGEGEDFPTQLLGVYIQPVIRMKAVKPEKPRSTTRK